jgi:hypothetical protein
MRCSLIEKGKMTENGRRERRGGVTAKSFIAPARPSSRPSKHETSDVLVPFVVLVDLDTNEMGLGAEPVHPTNALLPSATHTRTTLLVSLGDPTLSTRALAERVPLLGRDGGHECGVNRVENVQIRQRQRRLWPAILARRGTDRSDDDDPGQFRRAKDESRARWDRRFRRWLGECDGWEGRVHRAINDGACGWGEGDVVGDGGVV